MDSTGEKENLEEEAEGTNNKEENDMISVVSDITTMTNMTAGKGEETMAPLNIDFSHKRNDDDASAMTTMT
eukprot:12227671-Ditylum_brightwellii.AAC.1